MDPDDRAFMRELRLRHEKATDARIEELNALTRRVDAGTDAMIACTERPRAKVDEQRHDFIEEFRAGRAALFRILDRLDEGGSTAGA